MRKAFIKTLIEESKKNDKIMLLTGDLGFNLLEPFAEKFPNRFYNMGVSEQNMIGVAAGLALSGKIPFAYSIIPFITMRCFEQIRNDVCYQNANVKIVGVGSGFSYGLNGPTHHSLIDIAIMRALPNIIVVCPGDQIETKLAIKASIKTKKPVYIRLGKNDSIVHKRKIGFEFGKAITLKEGKDITLISTGNMLQPTLAVANELSKKFDCGVISMHTVKPIDKKAIQKAAKTNAIFSIEEHSIIGGLGGAVAEVLAELNKDVFFKRIGVLDKFASIPGNYQQLKKTNLLLPKQICKTILEELHD